MNTSISTTNSMNEKIESFLAKLYSTKSMSQFCEEQIEILESTNFKYGKYRFSNSELRILQDFLNFILQDHDPMHSIIILTRAASNSYANPILTKGIITFVFAVDQQDNTYTFEMQRQISSSVMPNTLFYSSMQLSRNFTIGSDNSNLKKHSVIVVSLQPWSHGNCVKALFSDIMEYKNKSEDCLIGESTMYNVVIQEGALEEDKVNVPLKDCIYFFLNGKPKKTIDFSAMRRAIYVARSFYSVKAKPPPKLKEATSATKLVNDELQSKEERQKIVELEKEPQRESEAFEKRKSIIRVLICAKSVEQINSVVIKYKIYFSPNCDLQRARDLAVKAVLDYDDKLG